MGILINHYVATYKGHVIELVGNNMDRSFKVLIDKKTVACRWGVFPQSIAFARAFGHEGIQRRFVATYHGHISSAGVVLEIDGEGILVEKIE